MVLDTIKDLLKKREVKKFTIPELQIELGLGYKEIRDAISRLEKDGYCEISGNAFIYRSICDSVNDDDENEEEKEKSYPNELQELVAVMKKARECLCIKLFEDENGFRFTFSDGEEKPLTLYIDRFNDALRITDGGFYFNELYHKLGLASDDAMKRLAKFTTMYQRVMLKNNIFYVSDITEKNVVSSIKTLSGFLRDLSRCDSGVDVIHTYTSDIRLISRRIVESMISEYPSMSYNEIIDLLDHKIEELSSQSNHPDELLNLKIARAVIKERGGPHYDICARMLNNRARRFSNY